MTDEDISPSLHPSSRLFPITLAEPNHHSFHLNLLQSQITARGVDSEALWHKPRTFWIMIFDASAPVKPDSVKERKEDCHAAGSDEGVSPSSGSTVAGAALNLTNAIVGAGCIGYGGAFAESGGLVSLVTIAVFAALTKQSFNMLIELGLQLVQQRQQEQQHNPEKMTHRPITAADSSFEAVGRAAYGSIGLASVVISKCLFAFGCMVAYFVIIKDNAALALQHLTGASSQSFWTDNVRLTIILASVLILPLCLQRDLSALEIFSKIKIATYGAIAAIVTVLCVNVHQESDEHDDMITSDNGDWVNHWLTVKPGLLPNTGTFVFAFVSQNIVHLIFLSLRPEDRNLKSFSDVSTLGIVASGVIMLAVGLPAYMTFWDKASTDLFRLYPPSQANTVNVARLLLSVGMVLTYPMPLFSLRDSLVQLLHGDTVDDEYDEGRTETTFLLEDGEGRHTLNSLSRVGVPWWFRKKQKGLETEDEETVQAPELIEPLHYMLTCTLWLSSLTLALSAPSLGIVLNLVGCLSGATMAFLLPGLFWAKLSGWTPLSVVLTVVGLVVACLGSYFTIVGTT